MIPQNPPHTSFGHAQEINMPHVYFRSRRDYNKGYNKPTNWIAITMLRCIPYSINSLKSKVRAGNNNDNRRNGSF